MVCLIILNAIRRVVRNSLVYTTKEMPMTNSLQILHIEPEKTLRQLFIDELEKAGFKLYSAGNLSEAQDILSLCSNQIDMVIISARLTQGYKFWIKMAIEHPSTPIIIVTDSSGINTQYNFVNASLKQPYSLYELESIILNVDANRAHYLIPYEKTKLILHHFLLNVVDKISQSQKSQFDISNIPQNDPHTFELLTSGNTRQIPWLSYEGISDNLRHARVRSIWDLAAIIALYKPGPMDIIESFIRRSAGLEQTVPANVLISHLVEDTMGLLVYKEQLKSVFIEFGGYSESEAITIMTALESHDENTSVTVRRKFLAEADKKGLSAESVDELFAMVKKLAPYLSSKNDCFEKASQSYNCAYLLIHYRTEYLGCYQ
jgi:CheY-like chemotaxis protein